MNKTMVLKGKCDIRHLATCLSYMASRGVVPRSTSELFYLCVETLAVVCLQTNEAKTFKTHEEAHTYMMEMGLGPITRRKGDRVAGITDLSKAIEEGRRVELDIEVKDIPDDSERMREEMLKILEKLKE